MPIAHGLFVTNQWVLGADALLQYHCCEFQVKLVFTLVQAAQNAMQNIAKFFP